MTKTVCKHGAFFKLRTDARHDRRQPLRRCRATSPCRGGSSCRENWSAVVLRPCTTARQARRQPLRSSASPGVARASRPWSGVARPSRPWSGVARPSRPWSGVARPSRPWQLCYYNKACYSNYARTHVMTGANPSGAVVPPPLAGEALLVVKTGARSFYGHARTHVMTGANPSGAVAPPPLAGEALLVVKT